MITFFIQVHHMQYQFKVWGEFSCFIQEANLLGSLSTSKKLRNDITFLKSFLCSYQRLKYRKTSNIQNAGMLSTGNPSGERTEGAKNWFIEKIKDSCFFAFCNRDIMGSYIFNSNKGKVNGLWKVTTLNFIRVHIITKIGWFLTLMSNNSC